MFQVCLPSKTLFAFEYVDCFTFNNNTYIAIFSINSQNKNSFTFEILDNKIMYNQTCFINIFRENFNFIFNYFAGFINYLLLRKILTIINYR